MQYKKGNKRRHQRQGQQIERVRMPRDKEIIGIVEEMLGGSRFRINCQDGNTRICRVSGKFKRNAWIRPGDVVIIEPWDVQGDERGDVKWKYRLAQVEVLRKKGIFKG
ncbi:MAG: translation initiation factor eIF-1A [Candidatus Micrarchaeota archaeon]|nr:translation initiation factor eIF-1A [Candidatus Micrarchaeota archaeon]